ncbi:hypothetical protein [Leptothoe sp. PORK10 BA2]|uniref:hypothetical protein n=1 Tax=Leptothoe sp. PORK10 BA2 TaxID=3110254 RepID=UPI002B20F698|nr:hypothetical protein [Leptothoe sp. PORK10 BA2]MEA5464472.1 hypothetical protein [Leptothoe sp. PORK10 BA2]
MATPHFESLEAGFYHWVNGRAAPGAEEGTMPAAVEVLFVDLAADPAMAVPPLSLAASWAIATGVYLFLPARPRDLGMVRSQLLELRRSPAYGQVRFLWLSNADESLAQWQFQSLSVDGAPADSRVSRLAAFDLGGYALTIPRRATIAPDESDSESGFVCSTERAYLTTDYGDQRLDGVGTSLQIALTDTGGKSVGSWQFALTLTRPEDGSDSTYGELAALDIGFRLFFVDPLFSSDAELFGAGVLYQSLRYPLWDEAAAQRYPEHGVTLQGCWDPLTCDRSFFSFVSLPDGTFPSLPSGYRTNLGYTVYLTPQASSRLVFAPKPGSSLDLAAQSAGLYLLPQGEFALAAPTHPENLLGQRPDYGNNLMCGLSGVEYIKLLETGTYTIGFVPSQPAFAPRYTSSQGLIQRLRDLIGFPDQRPLPTAPLNRYSSLTDLLGESRAEKILSILNTLLGEFFATGYRLPEKDQESLRLLSSNQLSTLGDLEDWFQGILRASRVQDDGGGAAPAGDPVALTPSATTAWAYVRHPSATPVYYAQPDQSMLYKPSTHIDLLNFLEVPAADLLVALDDAIPGPFPMFPYGSLPAGIADCRELELQVINPLRRAQIQQHYERQGELEAQTLGVRFANGTGPSLLSLANVVAGVGTASTEAVVSGTTSQGLLARFKEDYSEMTALVLARSSKNDQDQFLQFQNIERGSALWSAFQANQLLLIIDDAEALKSSFNDPDNPVQTITQLTIDGWTFSLDTVNDAGELLWRPDSVLLFKYYNKSLLELIEQPSLWSQAATFVGDEAKVAEVRQRLRTKLELAIALDTDATPPKIRKRYAPLANIARNPNWSGILGINIPVPPTDGFPPALETLAGGINKPFFAQYVGVNDTPIRTEGSSLVAEPSSLFALIDYENQDAPTAHPSGYNFQVLSLRALFENSRITDFDSEIGVTIDKLFGERTQLQEDAKGNNLSGRNLITLQGSTENHNGKPTYAFSFSGNNRFLMPNSAIFNYIDIIKAQFASAPIPEGDNPTITGRFSFWIRLGFRKLDKFDAFSFGPSEDLPTEDDIKYQRFLSASNLVVTLSFPRNNNKERTFAFVPDDLTFQPGKPGKTLGENSFRPTSLYAKFPITLKGFIQGQGKPKGVLDVKTALGKAPLAGAWYGLSFDIDLGSLGALSSVTKLVSSLVILWLPNPDPAADTRPEPQVYVGIKLPGLSGDVLGFPLQSVIKFSFKTAEFLFDPAKNNPEKSTYLLKLKAIVLKLLVLSLPPNGQTELLIFGNSEGRDQPIGWYAAYAKEPAPPASTGNPSPNRR